MRKITRDAVDAFMRREPFKQTNTEGGCTPIRHPYVLTWPPDCGDRPNGEHLGYQRGVLHQRHQGAAEWHTYSVCESEKLRVVLEW